MDAAIRATQAIHMISPAEIQELMNDRNAFFFLQSSFGGMQKNNNHDGEFGCFGGLR